VLLVRFTLRQMLFWTMILAIYLAFMRLTYDYFAWCAGQSRVNVCRGRLICDPVSLDIVDPEEFGRADPATHEPKDAPPP
jgi:hypothetical protein